MELNRELIIKALECCGKRLKDCYNCPYIFLCEDLYPDSISLILRLTDEKYDIECSYNHLKKDNERLYATCTELERKCASLTEENERLKAQKYMAYPDGRIEMIPTVESVKADTVRKMRERLTKEFDRMHKSNFITVEVRQWIIDLIAKEMLEVCDG